MLISLFVYRDRVPFVLTSDMVYVINNGEKQSDKFQLFVDLCCQAFNILRKNANLFLNLFALVRSPFEIILIDNVDLSNIFKFLQDNFFFLSWYMYIMTHCIHIMYIHVFDMVKAFKNALHRATMLPLDKMIFFFLFSYGQRQYYMNFLHVPLFLRNLVIFYLVFTMKLILRCWYKECS